ncbi:MAG: hypothetical protein A2289_08800 [Deltaproteobacteria bacterium RIFOXYA12_FULL_58_15]|nr:MAG: hypothetical protein A2289_08800 [Deltaproteobacteria bacterium RIFOXYA12_FULL_58_15]OGR08386.1 MAG: hypothetical protein A2341_17470 [Deltaproteobacteria bacterium RIFOXYB12_FULL_58_9]
MDRDLLAEITIENKLLLFDAENDVSIAIDERERLSREIHQTKLDIVDAELQVDEAEEDGDRAAEKGDEKRAQLSVMAGEVFLLKIDYLHEQLGFLRAKLAAQDELIMVAKAKYELAKAKLVKRNNVRGAQDIELADYEGQVDEYIGGAKETRLDLAEIEKEVELVKNQWLQTRDKLMASSGGGLGSPWAEDSALWGGSW